MCSIPTNSCQYCVTKPEVGIEDVDVQTIADKLDSGFHPSGEGQIRSNQYVACWPLQKTAGLKRAAVRGSRVAYVADIRKLPHVAPND